MANESDKLLAGLKKFCKERIDEIENDSRFKAEPALVQINAPLALIQVEMSSQHQTLKRILKFIREGQ